MYTYIHTYIYIYIYIYIIYVYIICILSFWIIKLIEKYIENRVIHEVDYEVAKYDFRDNIRCYLMKMSRGRAIYVICITVTSYITRSALFWSSVTSRSVRSYRRLCFLKWFIQGAAFMPFFAQRGCATSLVSLLYTNTYIDMRTCVRICVHGR